MRFGTVLGGLLLALGVVVLVNAVFALALPIVPLAVALLLVWGGLRLIKDNRQREGAPGGERVVAFGSGELSPEGEDGEARRLWVVGGKGLLDLTGLPHGEDVRVDLEVACGLAIIRFDPHTPLRIEVRSLASDCLLPDENRAFVGTLAYRSPAYRADAPAILVDVIAIASALRLTPGIRTTVRVAPHVGSQPVGFEPEPPAAI